MSYNFIRPRTPSLLFSDPVWAYPDTTNVDKNEKSANENQNQPQEARQEVSQPQGQVMAQEHLQASTSALMTMATDFEAQAARRPIFEAEDLRLAHGRQSPAQYGAHGLYAREEHFGVQNGFRPVAVAVAAHTLNFDVNNNNMGMRGNSGGPGLNYNHGFGQPIAVEYNNSNHGSGSAGDASKSWMHPNPAEVIALYGSSPPRGLDRFSMQDSGHNGLNNIGADGNHGNGTLVHCPYGHLYSINVGFCPYCWGQQHSVEGRVTLASPSQADYANSMSRDHGSNGVMSGPQETTVANMMVNEQRNLAQNMSPAEQFAKLREILEAATQFELENKSGSGGTNFNSFEMKKSDHNGQAERNIFGNGTEKEPERNSGDSWQQNEDRNNRRREEIFGPGEYPPQLNSVEVRENQFAAHIASRPPFFRLRQDSMAQEATGNMGVMGPRGAAAGSSAQIHTQAQTSAHVSVTSNGSVSFGNTLVFENRNMGQSSRSEREPGPSRPKGPARSIQELESIYEIRIRTAVSSAARQAAADEATAIALEDKFMIRCRRANHRYEFKYFPNCPMCAQDDFFMK